MAPFIMHAVELTAICNLAIAVPLYGKFCCGLTADIRMLVSISEVFFAEFFTVAMFNV